MSRWRTALGVLLVLGAASLAWAQHVQGVVVDQTGLPLPGATVQLMNGRTVVHTVVTQRDGSFTFDGALTGAAITASLDGFETTTVPRAEVVRVVLAVGRAAETTTVVGSTLAGEAPAEARLGSTLTATTVARLPSSRMRARESLPLLPSVIRGADGLMRLGGARPYETPLLIDGFNVTDPSTGTSSINLPYETVRGLQVLRDPMSIAYGGLVGGLVQIITKPGSDRFMWGVQGFIPRPRFQSPGAGRLEGIFPRVYVAGPAAAGRAHYFGAVEYDYERIPVPGVTSGTGPDLVEQSATMFGRVDFTVKDGHQLSVEAFSFPASTDSQGLSPLRDQTATTDRDETDMFAGLTDHIVLDDSTAFSVEIGVLTHDTTLSPNGSGPAYLSPAAWSGNWYASVRRHAYRYTASATWEHTRLVASQPHDLTITGGIAARSMNGTVANSPVEVVDAAGRLVRQVTFGPASAFSTQDWPVRLAVRDVWQPGDRATIDAGVRLDYVRRHGGGTPSGRVGLRYALDDAGRTVLKAGYGSFTGTIPLSVPGFGGYPVRHDVQFDPATGQAIAGLTLRPTVGTLRQPQAVAATLGIEHELRPGLDVQLSVTDRHSSRLATLRVPVVGESLAVASDGSASYREVQISVRKRWTNDQQLFLSYVRSSARGELNDFTSLFQALDQALVQHGGMSRLSTDAPDRVIAWGTFNLPARVVISPVTEWHSGFPYSRIDVRRYYVGRPDSGSFPAFMSTDLVIYKTFTVRKRSADLGIQLFNAFDHYNPRDVYAVASAPRAGDFTNSVGPILRGFMTLKF